MAEVQEKRESGLLDQLKQILFKEEYLNREQLEVELDKLKDEIHDPEKLKMFLEPHFKEHVLFLKENFPDLFKPMINASIQAHMREAQDEVIDAIYPMIGKIIKKYIQAEIEKLSNRIDNQLDKAFSFEGLIDRIKAFFSGVKYEEMIIRDAANASVEEIFVINKENGLLLGHYSVNNLIDADMIAGMLTGIKGFIEHAFQKGQQQLQTLEYENYKILVHNFHTFYIASLVQGTIDHQFRARLEEKVMGYCESYDLPTHGTVDKALVEDVSEGLKTHFYGFNEVDE